MFLFFLSPFWQTQSCQSKSKSKADDLVSLKSQCPTPMCDKSLSHTYMNRRLIDIETRSIDIHVGERIWYFVVSFLKLIIFLCRLFEAQNTQWYSIICQVEGSTSCYFMLNIIKLERGKTLTDLAKNHSVVNWLGVLAIICLGSE